jgi:hypothetical protein
MSGPIIRKYGFPNFEKIFGERELKHGAPGDAAMPADPPLPTDPPKPDQPTEPTKEEAVPPKP